MLASAYTRAKQPEQVRRALLDCAAAIAMDHGVSGVTVQAVAAAAGVTKGGLFHHFGSKQALIEGLFADLLARVDAEIDAAVEADPKPRGSFYARLRECGVHRKSLRLRHALGSAEHGRRHRSIVAQALE